jgi:RNase H-fold protein (predicted Holliday junction resolvase)
VEDNLDALKHSPAVLQVYQKYTKLRQEGKKWVGVCALHSESSGSFTVFPDMLFKCFGCSKQGNCFQYLEMKEGISFKDAVSRVKEITGTGNYKEQAAKVDAIFRPAVESAKDLRVFTLKEFASLERNFAANKAAQDVLTSRGITVETAQRLHTGYKQSIKMRPDDKNFDLADQGWLAFPCIVDGKVVAIKYRSLIRKAFSKQAGMNTTALYNPDTIDPFSDVILVEGELDCMVLEQAGYHACSIASASTNIGPAEKDRLMTASRVVLAGDSDEVGAAAMEKLWRGMPERTFNLTWDGGVKDANELYLKCKSKEEFVQKMDGLIGNALKQPMKDVYDIASVMASGSTRMLADHPNRLRLPWPSSDQMAILLPGSVTTVISTNSGMGKSSWVLQATLYGAQKYNEVVLAYHCEMSPQELGVMVAAQTLKKNRNHLSTSDLREAAEILGSTKYYVGYDPELTTAETVLDLLDIAIPRLGCTVAVIDHIHHLCQDESNSIAQQSAAMQRIKQMAVKHQVKFIVVAQPRKANQQSKGKQLHMSDAKGSEAISSMADAMFAIHREITKSDGESLATDTYESKTLIKALKTRSKGEGKMESYLTFMGEFSAFSEIDYLHTGEPE